MRRFLRVVLVLAVVAGDVAAQQLPVSRFGMAVLPPRPPEATRPGVLAVPGAADDAPGPPAGIVAAQVFVSALGFTAGGLVGGFIGAATVRDSQESFLDLAAVLMGVIVGGMFGSSGAVYSYSKFAGYEAPYWGALLGSASGIVGGQYFYVTMPIGAVLGHNLARRTVK